jgi:hypothetical protein
MKGLIRVRKYEAVARGLRLLMQIYRGINERKDEKGGGGGGGIYVFDWAWVLWYYPVSAVCLTDF